MGFSRSHNDELKSVERGRAGADTPKSIRDDAVPMFIRNDVVSMSIQVFDVSLSIRDFNMSMSIQNDKSRHQFRTMKKHL